MNGFRVVVASKDINGLALDCNVNTGLNAAGGAATDDTAVLQAFLNTISVTNPTKIIYDGGSLITGLHLPATGHICIDGLGWDTGWFMKAGSNSTALDNGPLGATAGPQAGNITLRNFQINGNRGNGTTGNCTSGDPRAAVGGAWKFNVDLHDVNGLIIENMLIFDAPTYAVRLTNCVNTDLRKNVVWNPNTTTTLNNDGIHLNGPGNDVTIDGNIVYNNYSDDGIAINAPEGYAGGVLDRIRVTNNSIIACLHAVRMYGSVDNQVGQIIVANNSCVVSECMVLIGVFNGVATGDVNGQAVIIDSNTCQTLGTTKRLIEIDSGVGNVTISNNTWYGAGASAQGFVWLQGAAATVSGLHFVNNRVYIQVNGASVPQLLYSFFNTATIKRMTIDGYYIVAKQGITVATLANALAMTNITINDLHIADLDYGPGRQITGLADGFTTIGKLTGYWQNDNNILTGKTSAYTLLPTDRVVVGNTTSASFAVTLPATAYIGQRHTIKNLGTANTLTVTGTVDGTANPTLAALASMTVMSPDGNTANWIKV
jgi:hypothetical protein